MQILHTLYREFINDSYLVSRHGGVVDARLTSLPLNTVGRDLQTYCHACAAVFSCFTGISYWFQDLISCCIQTNLAFSFFCIISEHYQYPGDGNQLDFYHNNYIQQICSCYYILYFCIGICVVTVLVFTIMYVSGQFEQYHWFPINV